MSPGTLTTLALFILFIPLASFIILLAFGKRLPRQGDTIATGLLFGTLGLSLVTLFGTLTREVLPAIPGFPVPPIQAVFTWIDFNSTISVLGQTVPLKIELGIMLDNLTAIMLVVVTLISSVVHLYSIGYMHGDPKYSRYFSYLGLFSFSMLGIVLTNNILMMYVFWELVGVSSYLLIGFWYEKRGPAYASMKAFLVNRIGDAGMFIGILILFTTYGSFRFDVVFAQIAQGQFPMNSEFWLTMTGIFLFAGAVGKSAQFPLQTWLPDAMEGPTPVSALIHAATMVAAGVYLVARIFPMLAGDTLLFIALIGTVTSFIAATIALVQNDIKKALAYSTVSQLGYMVMALGAGAYKAGVFHLVTHAMFKACLFLGSGSVIHAMHHSLHHIGDHETDAQDMRYMGGLKSKMPFTYWTFLIATLAISGVPLFSGFLSKDEILAGTWALGGMKEGIAQIIPWVGFGVAFMTAFYMFRVVLLTFHGEPKRPDIFAHIKESPRTMTIPLMVLAALSFWFVFAFNPFGASTGWFMKSLPTPVTVTGNNWYKIGHGTAHTVSHEAPAHEAVAGEAQTPVESAAQPVQAMEQPQATEHETQAAEAMPPAGQEPAPATPAVTENVQPTAAPQPEHKPVVPMENEAQLALEHATHGAHLSAMITSIFVAGLGILFAFVVYFWKKIDADAVQAKLQPVHTFLSHKWYFDEIYEQWIVVPGLLLIARITNWFDARVVDGAVNGTAYVTRVYSTVSGWFDKWVVDGLVNLTAFIVGFFGLVFRKAQTGRIQTYLAFVVVGIVVLLYIFYFRTLIAV